MTNLPTLKVDVEKLRLLVSKLQHTLNWYDKRSGLLPYDWNSYFLDDWNALRNELKVAHDEHILKQDKRGAWR